MELNDFYSQIMADINQEYHESLSVNSTSGLFKEEIFTNRVLELLEEENMTVGEPQYCYYNTKIRNANVRINGYAMSANEDEGCLLDLYISKFIDTTDEIPHLQDGETQKIATQCVRFLEACQNGSIFDKIDSSCENERMLALTINSVYDSLVKVQIFVLTNAQVNASSFKPVNIHGKSVNLEVMDIGRLFRHTSSGRPQDEIIVDFKGYCGKSIPCVYVAQPESDYDCLLCSIPGEVLFKVYEKYGDRLLEANVRSFLGATGKVNKGIRETLKTEPLRFMAYNNGIVVTVTNFTTEKTEQGYCISALQGMQIVNGGQTIASLFFTKKAFPATELSKVRISAKILFLHSTDTQDNLSEENLFESFIHRVSFFSNSQNSVKIADLSSNKPFHVAMEKLANTTYCPDGFTRWFYERGSGKYKTMLLREGTTAAKKRKISAECPTSKKISKTDLAKYLFAWEQKPHLVSLGAQRNFELFMQEIELRENNNAMPEMDKQFFKETIAKVIVYKGFQSILRNRLPGFQWIVVTYLIAMLVRQFGHRIRLDEIWKQQELSPQFKAQAIIWGLKVYHWLENSSNGKIISEWAKRKECWDALQQFELPDYSETIPEIRDREIDSLN